MKLFTALCCLPLAMGMTLTGQSWEICDEHPGKITQVDLDPCTKELCNLSVDSDYIVKAIFQPTHDTGNDCILKGELFLNGLWLDMVEESACGTLLACPLKKGQSTVLTRTMTVAEELLHGELTTRWKLTCNSNVDEVFCGKLAFNFKHRI